MNTAYYKGGTMIVRACYPKRLIDSGGGDGVGGEGRGGGGGAHTHLAIGRRPGGMLQQSHVGVAVVPQEGGVVQPPPTCYGLRVAADLGLPETVVCAWDPVISHLD